MMRDSAKAVHPRTLLMNNTSYQRFPANEPVKRWSKRGAPALLQTDGCGGIAPRSDL